MPPLAEAWVRIRPDTSTFRQETEKGVTSAGPALKKIGDQHGKLFGTAFVRSTAGPLRGIAGVIGRPVAAAFAVIGGAKLFAGFIAEGREAQKVGAQTAAVIKSTGGAAKISSKQVGDLATAISNKVGVDDEAIQSGANLLLTFCLEESAQALSRERGWVSHAELRAGDEILAYDPDDGSIRWEPVDSVHRFAVDSDEMVRWQSRQIDVLSTPTHRWWTVGQNDRSRHTPQFQTTEQISGKQVRVLIGGGDPQAFAGEPTWSDELVELAGWIITEGWVDWERPSTRERNGVHFCQSLTANPDNVKRIRLLLNRLRTQGHRISETSQVAAYNGSTVLSWHIARDLGATLRMMLPDKKLTQQFVMSLTREQAGLLVDVLVLADGHTDRHGHRQYVQKDRGQLDILAGLCAMLGIRTTDVRSRSTAGALYLNSTNHAYGNRLNARREHYKGVVWCPHLRTGVWMARVRGRTFWTGNTGIRNEAGKGNRIFDQATTAVVDMTAAMNGGKVTQEGMKAASIQVGKALNDPIKGMTALRKVGVSFTDQQVEQVKAMVKSGNTLGAQKLILRELNKEFGGSAAAGTNAMQKLGVVFGNIKEQVGTALLPVIDRVAAWLGARLPAAVAKASLGLRALTAAFREGDITSDGFVGVMERIGVSARRTFDYFKAEVLPRLRDFGGFLKDVVLPQVAHFADFLVRNRETLIPLIAALGTIVAGIKAYILVTKIAAAVQLAWNAAALANPIGVIIILIAALVVGVITAYKTSSRFREIVQATWRGIQAAASVAWAVLKGIFAAIVAAFTWVGRTATSLWQNVLRPVFKFIVGAWLTVAGAIINGAARAFGWVPGIGPKLKTAAAEFNKFAGKVNAALDSTTKPRTVDITARLKALGITPHTTAGLQSGGKLPGYGGGDIVPAMLEPGEAVVPKHLVPEMAGWARQRGIPGFARGGVAGGLQVSPHLAGASRFEAAISAFNRRIDDVTVALARTLGGLGKVVDFARSQAGKPYVWGAAGPGGYDCSGFVSNLVEVAKGLPLYRRLFATGSMGSYPWRGQFGRAFQVGWTANAGGGIGHTAATVNGVPMESRGGDGVVVGSRSRGANQSIFSRHAYLAKGGLVLPGDPPFDLLDPRGKYFQPGLLEALRTARTFDSGGWLHPGQVGINRSTRSERVRSGPQEDALLVELRALRRAVETMPAARIDNRTIRRDNRYGDTRGPGGW